MTNAVQRYVDEEGTDYARFTTFEAAIEAEADFPDYVTEINEL